MSRLRTKNWPKSENLSVSRSTRTFSALDQSTETIPFGDHKYSRRQPRKVEEALYILDSSSPSRRERNSEGPLGWFDSSESSPRMGADTGEERGANTFLARECRIRKPFRCVWFPFYGPTFIDPSQFYIGGHLRATTMG